MREKEAREERTNLHTPSAKKTTFLHISFPLSLHVRIPPVKIKPMINEELFMKKKKRKNHLVFSQVQLLDKKRKIFGEKPCSLSLFVLAFHNVQFLL